MRKRTVVMMLITISVIQIFSAEFILGEKYARKNGAQLDTTTDSTALVRDTAFYMDSAEVAALDGIRGQTMSGQRSRASIMRGIDQNANSVRKEYHAYIRQGNKLSGGMIVRFKIVPSGEVIECKIVESSIGDIAFEKMIALAVKKWKFPQAQIKNDTTVVEYPFVFEQVN